MISLKGFNFPGSTSAILISRALTFPAQRIPDTLNGPTDKLLLSELIQLGDHSILSGRWQ